MNIIYLITYLPHVGSNNPIFYIGSKYGYRRRYIGSLSSKQIFPYTIGKPLCEWWKSENCCNPQDFVFEILYDAGDVTPQELVEIERRHQIDWGVTGPLFFNQSLAGGRFVSRPRTVETRALIATRTKEFWVSPAGLEKKERLRTLNRETKSQQVRDAWNRPGFRETQSALRKGVKRSDQSRERYRQSKLQNIEFFGKNYLGFDALEMETGVSRHLYKKYYLSGIDPRPLIKKRF